MSKQCSKVNIWNDVSEEKVTLSQPLIGVILAESSIKNTTPSHERRNPSEQSNSITPIIMYGAGCWTLSQSEEQHLDALREEVRRKIYDPIQNSGNWRNRFIFYLYRMYLNSFNKFQDWVLHIKKKIKKKLNINTCPECFSELKNYTQQ